jgi:type I restriction enzyme R subunit
MADRELPRKQRHIDGLVAPDQIRMIIKTFKERLFTEIFPGRKDVPKTLIYAKDDSHADDIVQIVREEFGKGNDFCQKITYKTTGVDTDDLIASFRNSYYPRIAVTVDMIATGTDIKPLEIVFFMRSIRSRTFFEQMKGRGVRVISDTDFQAVTPDAKTKTHFVIVDAVGVCERDKTESRPLERRPTVSFEKLLEAVAFGNREEEVLTSVASRIARLERRLDDEDKQELLSLSGGQSLKSITEAVVHAVDPDAIEETARLNFKTDDPTTQQLKAAALKTSLCRLKMGGLFTKDGVRNARSKPRHLKATGASSRRPQFSRACFCLNTTNCFQVI